MGLIKRQASNHYDYVVAIGSQMDYQDFATSCALEVTLETSAVGSRYDASDAFTSVLILAVITPHIDS